MDDDPFVGPDAGAQTNPDPNPDPQQKPDLSIDDVAASTEYLSIPVTGTGPENGKIIVETATDSNARDIGADGSFCIDVPLQKGISNSLWFKAMDANGVYSDEIEITVTQDGDPPDGSNDNNDGSQLRNIAELGEVWMNDHVQNDGNPQFMADGDPTTMVEVENDFWADNDFVAITLTDTAPLDHIRVRSTSDCPIKHYHVLVTDAADPGDPPANYNLGYVDTPWEEIAEITDGTGDETITAPLQAHPVINHVALLTRTGCSGTWDPENFQILEVEAFTADEAAPPTSGPQGPTCSSGAPN